MSRVELRNSEFIAIAAAIGAIRNSKLRQHVANQVFRAVWLHAPSRLVGNGYQPNDGIEWFAACRTEYSK